MEPDTLKKLKGSLDSLTPAERAVAKFVLRNKHVVHLETAASVATKLGVSAMTVGRFCRKMGFRHFKDLKSSLRPKVSDVPWLSGDQLAAFQHGGASSAHLKAQLENEIAGLVEAYSLTEKPAWEKITNLLATAAKVHVVGTPGPVEQFCYFLNLARDHVYLVDRRFDHYANLFADPKGSCLVVIDTRRYGSEHYRLCEQARAAGLGLIMLTDNFCDWAEEMTRHVLKVSTDSQLVWDSLLPLHGLIQVLVNSVVGKLDANVEDRMRRLTELRQRTAGFVDYWGGHSRRGSGV